MPELSKVQLASIRNDAEFIQRKVKKRIREQIQILFLTGMSSQEIAQYLANIHHEVSVAQTEGI